MNFENRIVCAIRVFPLGITGPTLILKRDIETGRLVMRRMVVKSNVFQSGSHMESLLNDDPCIAIRVSSKHKKFMLLNLTDKESPLGLVGHVWGTTPDKHQFHVLIDEADCLLFTRAPTNLEEFGFNWMDSTTMFKQFKLLD